MSENDHWFILGAGAIGCLWAARLKEANISCTFIIRPESKNKYGGSQLTLHSDNTQQQFPMACSPSHTLTTPIENLIITVKANHAIDAINNIKSAISDHATVLILLNGVGIQQQIAKLLPKRTIWIGSTTDGAWIEKPLTVHHAGKGITWLGLNDATLKLPHPIPFIKGLDIRICDNIHSRLWQKLAINSVINGLTARYRCKNGELIKYEDRRQRVYALAKESEQILKKLGIQLDESILDLSLRAIKNTAANRSSTLQDVIKKQSTELPWINGILIAEANRLNIELHEHKRLMYELHQMKIQ